MIARNIKISSIIGFLFLALISCTPPPLKIEIVVADPCEIGAGVGSPLSIRGNMPANAKAHWQATAGSFQPPGSFTTTYLAPSVTSKTKVQIMAKVVADNQQTVATVDCTIAPAADMAPSRAADEPSPTVTVESPTLEPTKVATELPPTPESDVTPEPPPPCEPEPEPTPAFRSPEMSIDEVALNINGVSQAPITHGAAVEVRIGDAVGIDSVSYSSPASTSTDSVYAESMVQKGRCPADIDYSEIQVTNGPKITLADVLYGDSAKPWIIEAAWTRIIVALVHQGAGWHEVDDRFHIHLKVLP